MPTQYIIEKVIGHFSLTDDDLMEKVVCSRKWAMAKVKQLDKAAMAA